ncbi:MAG TPA: hypothetical protein VKX49_24445 [Bryobacteraceae bacterium]|nr:hypothetical protein [Bryobacteraceae bacterium]
MVTPLMIDKLDFRVPADAPYSRDFSALYQEIANNPKGPFRQGRHYLKSACLQEYGHPVVLHVHCLHGKRGDHKLELLDTGTMSYSQMADVTTRVFKVRPEDLRIMRIDFAADVPGVPVTWFEKHVLAKYKRWVAEIGKLDAGIEFASMGRRGVETLYLGRRPNLFRIYNKIAEYRAQFDRQMAALRRNHQQRDIDLPTFQQLFGYPETGLILTRVERQINSRIPEQLATFGYLRNSPSFNPFAPLVFAETGKPQPSPDDYDLPTYATGMLIRGLVEQGGIHRAKQFLNRHSKRNANRILKRHVDFLPPADEVAISPEKLFELYQESVSRQLAA